MQRNLMAVLVAVAVPAVAGCGGDGDDTAAQTTTVTVATTQTETVTAPAEAPPAADTGETEATKAPASVGPPLPSGVVGIDGRFVLKSVQDDFEGQNIGDRFFSYEEPSNATTTCAGGACSVKFRLGLRSGGSKTYTLKADPGRKGTYVGTGAGQVDCNYTKGRVSSRERVAARIVTDEDVAGRQVARRLDVYVTTTARCDDEAAKSVVLLRGSRDR